MMFQSPLPEDVQEEDGPDSMIGRRVAPRLAVRVPARFRIGSRSNDVVVCDISASGARLMMSAPPPKGAIGALVWEDMECRCTVAWSAKESFGVQFDTATPAPDWVIARSHPSRRDPLVSNIPVPLPSRAEPPPRIAPGGEQRVEVRQKDRWLKVRLKSVSRDEFTVGWFVGCQVRQPISLRGPGLPALQGRVIWSDNQSVLCKLDAPLHAAVLDHMRQRIGAG